MTVPDEIIKVLDYLCEKIGVTINWASSQVSDNVLPYIQEVVRRYTIYEIIFYALWLFISIILYVGFKQYYAERKVSNRIR